MPDERTIPPLTVEQVRAEMNHDSTRTSYLYVGAESDAGWRCALDVEGLLPRLVAFRAEAPDGLWFEIRTGEAAVFGFDDNVIVTLNAQKAATLSEVIKANSGYPV